MTGKETHVHTVHIRSGFLRAKNSAYFSFIFCVLAFNALNMRVVYRISLQKIESASRAKIPGLSAAFTYAQLAMENDTDLSFLLPAMG